MAEIDVIIDDLGNSIIHRETGEVFATRIAPWDEITAGQRASLARWRFDWPTEVKRASRQVVALLALRGSDAIQGLMSFEPKPGFVFVHLVENAPHNIGQSKLFHGVAANLFNDPTQG